MSEARFPPLPRPVAKSAHGLPLFDAMQMYQYAMKGMTMKPDAQTHQALSLLQQAFDALEATADSDIDAFEDEEEEAEAVPAQYACRKIMEAMGLLK